MERDPDPNAGESAEIFPDSPERKYFGAVECRFQQLRGSPILLSPKDWMRIASWWERSIPIEVVLAGIELAFEKRRESSPGATVRSLGYCEPIILDTWERRRQLSVAKRAAHSGLPAMSWTCDRLRGHFTRLTADLRAAAAAVPAMRMEIDRCIMWIEQVSIGKEASIPPERLHELEEGLLSHERQLAAAAQRSLSAVDIDEVRSEVEEKLRPYRDMMSEEIFRETREFLLQDGFRRRVALPRLSLFSVS